MNSRFLLYEAQQAHYYGLAHNLALASVTTTPAYVMGMDHRIGYVRKGESIYMISGCLSCLTSEQDMMLVCDDSFLENQAHTILNI